MLYAKTRASISRERLRRYHASPTLADCAIRVNVRLPRQRRGPSSFGSAGSERSRVVRTSVRDRQRICSHPVPPCARAPARLRRRDRCEGDGVPVAAGRSGLLALYAAEGSPKFGKAAVRWLGRLALESDDLSLHDVQLAAAALHALPRRPGLGVTDSDRAEPVARPVRAAETRGMHSARRSGACLAVQTSHATATRMPRPCNPRPERPSSRTDRRLDRAPTVRL